jgi:nucleoid DNA-binding protein
MSTKNNPLFSIIYNSFLRLTSVDSLNGTQNLEGSGTFSGRTRKAKICKNPGAGQEIRILATKATTLRTGKALKEEVIWDHPDFF